MASTFNTWDGNGRLIDALSEMSRGEGLALEGAGGKEAEESNLVGVGGSRLLVAFGNIGFLYREAVCCFSFVTVCYRVKRHTPAIR